MAAQNPQLPQEMICRIIEILVKLDLKTAMRLRSVSKSLNGEIIRAICKTHALEQRHSTFPLTQLPRQILSQSLVTRTLKAKTNVSVYSRAVQNTIDYLIALRPNDKDLRDEYTRKLCMATARYYNPSFYALLLTADGGTAIKAPPLLSNVLAASLILGLDEIFEDCMKAHVQIDVWQPLFGHPIELAVEKDDITIIRALLNSVPSHREYAVACAANTGKPWIARALLSGTSLFTTYRFTYDEILSAAARAGHVETTDFLIHRVESGQAPESYVDYLCSCITSFNHGDGILRTSFWYSFVLCEACCFGQERLARWALNRGGDPNIYYSELGAAAYLATALEAAARFGHVGIVKLLLRRGAKLGVNNKGAGGIALSRAVKLGHTEVVKLMLANGYNINDDCRQSYARMDPRVQPVNLLLESVQKNRVHSLKLLLEVGLKIDITKGIGKEAFEYARDHGHDMILEMLQEAAA